MSEKNRFGGDNPHGLYMPMTDVEQEILARLVESQTLRVRVPRWVSGDIIPTKVGFGDKRVQVVFQVFFAPPMPMTELPSIDIELCTAEGILLLAKPYPLMNAHGKPVIVGENVTIDLVWDIAIDHMNPQLVKTLKPGAIGLTTRRLDRETGNRTVLGNMRLLESDASALFDLDKGEAAIRALDPATIHKLEQKLDPENIQRLEQKRTQ